MRKLLLPRGAVNAVYLPYLQSSRRYQIFFGGASSGKSCFLATRAVLDTLQGRSTLVIRQVARTLRTSCWNEIGKAAARLGLTGCFRFNKTEMTVTARNNGAQILFAGLDDVEKIKSISPAGGALTDIWIEEATEIIRYEYDPSDEIESLCQALRACDSPSVDAELAMQQSVFGRAVELCYADENARPRCIAVDPRDAFVVYSDDELARPLFGVYLRYETDLRGNRMASAYTSPARPTAAAIRRTTPCFTAWAAILCPC